MIRATELLFSIGSATLIFNSLLVHPRTWVLFVCAGAFAALTGLHRPSLSALTPRLIPSEMVPAAAALNSVTGTIGGLAGPILGGLLAATAGPAFAYSVDLGTFVISLLAIWMMRAVPPPANADRPSLQSVRDGLRYAWSRPELMGTYLVDINAMFFGMPMALFPAVAEYYGGASVGFLYAAPFGGALLVSLTSRWASRVHRHGLAIVIAASVWGMAIIGFGLVNRLWLAILCLGVAGASDMISGLFRMTIWNQTIPDHLRGRLAGIEMISYTTGPLLGNAESGIVASAFGLRTSILSGGVLCVLGTGLLALALPKFVRYDGRDGTLRKQAEEEARSAATV